MSCNTVKTTVLLTVLTVVFIGVGGALGGAAGLVTGLLIGVGITGASSWYSDRIAIRAARARPVTEAQMPEYYAIVRDLTTRGGMPMPALYVTPDPQPNALATGRNPDHATMAVTEGILQLCTWDELRGVLAHEISPLAGRQITMARYFADHPPLEDRIARLRSREWAR